MSALDLLSLNPVAEPKSPVPFPAETSEANDTSRSFRDELSEAEPRPSSELESRRDVTRERDAQAAEAPVSEPTEEAAAADRSSDVATDETAEAQAESAESEVAAEGEVSDASAATEGESDQTESPVGELVSELIAAFENVLENNPLAQAVEGAANGETPSPFPGLTALFEALSAVSAITGANAGQGVAAATTTVTPQTTAPVLPATGAANATASVTTIAPENASAQTQTGQQFSEGQSQSGFTQGQADPGVTEAKPGSSNVLPATALPGSETAASRTAAQPVSPLVNSATQAGTDVSARLAPTGQPNQNTTDALNAARLSRGLSNAVNQQGGAVTLRLTPPEMGTVRIQLNLQGSNVSAQFHAETDSAQRLLTQQLGQLRSSLESQGLNVEKLGVQSMSSSSNSSSLQQQANSDSQQSQTNADGRSRGQFNQSSQQDGQGDGAADDSPAPADFTQIFNADLSNTETETAPANPALGAA
ncbi:flagellar hook-length control protein FliK [Algisphaera agarilytica]|uniref:Flagellar hook-length control protein FliK n=1 Tax=Algisphaera agarilytica TaxID=1385975 RepID=A0A7X0LL83_9BACT|nr:flagellar hook-length control protein FliK [Algisphaera agarilytica]MBB6430742.1 flagellar hook-length control protein FliK [Algisphaera agarilytica]